LSDLTHAQKLTLRELNDNEGFSKWRIIGNYHGMPVVSDGVEYFALTPKRVATDKRPGMLRVIKGTHIERIENE
jgi:hypothetical protein